MHVVMQPYFLFTKKYSTEEHTHEIQSLWIAVAGLTDGLDVQIAVQGSAVYKGRQSSTQLGDSSIRLAFQLLEAENTNWHPDIQFFVRETFPMGNYDSLDPVLKGIDARGGGVYATTVGFNVQKIILMPNQHPLRLRFNIGLQASTRAKVRRASIYGTEEERATGYAYPGENLLSLFAAEYHLDKRWVAAVDLFHIYQAPDRFRGSLGMTESVGLITNQLVNPTIHTFAIAPAIEYNFTEDVGIIGGCGISGFGENSTFSLIPTVALNIYQ
ncbi:hypothetical protein BCY86_04265 [Pajaroellobacter abortibovis]|uniref:Uncharacterized protein n=2 Tax=Pajaroellobacter abortibovis TaxID=1882918 RepID=A0A1L6MWS2_9BACT|nr:hypothetical protein BCY86_04265 [Pajaroellobacter abortibovis]